jgi:hypothetical protein
VAGWNNAAQVSRIKSGLDRISLNIGSILIDHALFSILPTTVCGLETTERGD